MLLKERIRKEQLRTRVPLYGKVKWLTKSEYIRRYSRSITKAELEVLETIDFKFPVNEK